MDLEQIWNGLIAQAGQITSKPIGLWPGGLLVASVSAAKVPELVIQVAGWDFKSTKPAPSTLQTKGFEIWYEYLTLGGQETACVTLRPKLLEDAEMFFALAKHLVGKLADVQLKTATVDEVENQIQEWVDYWKRLRSNPDKKKILGLIGELLAIDRWIETSSLSFEAWQGPKGGPHDFCGVDKDLEVKVTSNRTGALLHEISSIHQLETQAGKSLQLLSFRLGLSKTGAHSLHELVARVTNLIMFSGSKAKDWMDDALRDAGYSLELEADLASYDLWAEALFNIGEGFPRLTRELLPADPRLLDLKYTVNFGGCDDYLVATEPISIKLD
jgi:hypothetical protein